MTDAPVILIVRDGWGCNPDPAMDQWNAIVAARTPIADVLHEQWPTTLVGTCGEQVGLPTGVMGNSEVGHQNIGAGRIVPQELMRLNMAIDDGSFATNAVLMEAFSRTRTGHAVHIVGLVSDGCVHSDIAHVLALIDMAPTEGDVFVHVITDGRDCAPDAGGGFVRRIEDRIAGTNVRIATIMGRYYAMDRDNRWERVAVAWEAMTGRRANHPLRKDMPQAVTAYSALDAVQHYYENPSEPSRRGDEFIVPTTLVNDDGPIGLVQESDAIIFFNYRGDRPRELTKAFVLDDGAWAAVPRGPFDRGPRFDDLYYATMTNYETNLPVSDVAFDKPPPMADILGDVVASAGLTQFRCAETEKFPHVTFFFNDYREEPFDGERRVLVPSPTDVTTYDQEPAMSADAVCEAVLSRLADAACESLIIVNFANGDMVGHTGDMDATVAAIECVDRCVGSIMDAALAVDARLLITADHGNAERMFNPETGMPDTAHTTYDVPLHVVRNNGRSLDLRTGGILADIAPTLLQLMDLPIPASMTGRSLIIP